MNFFILVIFFIYFANLVNFSKAEIQSIPELFSISPKQTQKVRSYSKHWFGELPQPRGSQKLLLIHDIFIISFDLEKKFPSWVAYHLSPDLAWGGLKLRRKYVLDPLLSPSQSLTFEDYKGASRCDNKKTGYDKGHLAPLGSFKNSVHAYQAQYLSNIIPQTRKLNQGPWRRLEEQVRDFVKRGNKVRILTGPIFGKEAEDKTPPCWKAAQGKLEEIPSSYWKIVAFKYKSKIKACAFLMPQNIKNQKDSPKKYKVKLEQIEQNTDLKLFTKIKKSVLQDCRFLF